MKDGDILKQRVELKDGELYWREWDGMRPNQRALAGEKVGGNTIMCGAVGYDKRPYRNMQYTVAGKRKSARFHRVIYFLATGEDITEKVIDHINGDTLDNRIENLRAVTGKENQRNTKLSSNSTTGINGVTKRKYGKPYEVQIHVDGKAIYLGTFATLEEAAAARAEADKRYGFSGRHGASQ